MRLVFICLDNYPQSGACSKLLNNLFFYGGLNNADYEINVLTRRNSFDEPAYENFQGIKIYRCFIWSSFAFKKKFRKGNAKGLPIRKIASAKAINKIALTVSKAFFYGLDDFLQLYRSLKMLNIRQDDVVIPVAGYFSDIAAALAIKRKTNCHLVTYLVDPCSTNTTAEKNTIEARKKFEQKFFNISDRIITTPLIFQEKSELNDASILLKTISMEFPNVLCREDSVGRAKSDKTVCVYSGRMYAGRNINYVLDLFSYLKNCNISLQLVGISDSDIHDRKEMPNVECLGYMSIDKAQSYSDNSDFLINIGNSMTNQVPSKLFEYISTGKPIINICQNKNCPTFPYLKKYPYVLNLLENDKTSEEQAEAIKKFISENAGKRAAHEEILSIYKECTPRYCANQMIEVFKSLR